MQTRAHYEENLDKSGMSTHPDSIKWERKEPNTLPLYHTHSNQGWLLCAFYWCMALAQDTGNRQETGPLWTSQGKTKTFSVISLESRGIVLHVIHEKTRPRNWRHLLLRSFKCCSRDNWMQTCLRLPCNYWWGIIAVIARFCRHVWASCTLSRAYNTHTGRNRYIRLPYNMNCHSYTRSGKRHKYFKCKQQKMVI